MRLRHNLVRHTTHLMPASVPPRMVLRNRQIRACPLSLTSSSSPSTSSPPTLLHRKPPTTCLRLVAHTDFQSLQRIRSCFLAASRSSKCSLTVSSCKHSHSVPAAVSPMYALCESFYA